MTISRKKMIANFRSITPQWQELIQVIDKNASNIKMITTWDSIPISDVMSNCSGIPTVQAHRANENAAGGAIKYVVHILLPSKSLIDIFSEVLLSYIRTMYDVVLGVSDVKQGILSQFNTPYDMLVGIGYELSKDDSAIKYASKLRDSENCWLLLYRFFGQELPPQSYSGPVG